MESSSFEETLRALTRERDLYLKLLELNTHEQIEPFLEEALLLLVDSSRAERGYIELYSPESRDCSPPWWYAEGITEEELLGVRHQLSGQLIAGALARAEVVETACAVQDSRYEDIDSVRRNSIRAVLCAPIGVRQPVGVVYLQGRIGDTPFDARDRRRIEAFAQHLGPHAGRIVAAHTERDKNDPTRSLRKELNVESFLGRTAAVAQVLTSIAFTAKIDAIVQLCGPTGTGKSLVARLIHDNSPRREAPFVHLNCSDDDAEERLFGGGGSGGSSLLTRAHMGTLFLEEVGELSPSAQERLMAVLESRSQAAVADGESCEHDVRILVSSSIDLRELARKGGLRNDLCYQLEVMKTHLPPLSERSDDISELAQHFCAKVCAENHLSRLRLSLGAITALEAHEWTSNLDELRQVIARAALAADSQGLGMIDRRHVFPDVYEESPDNALSYSEATRRFQRRLLERMLGECEWNVTQTARRLEVARSHVYNLIQSFKIER